MADHERPADRLRRLMDGARVSQAIRVAATLNIADQLREGPRSADELASVIDAHPRALYRLLRALASVDIFHEEADGRFSNNELSECLRPDAPEPRGDYARYFGNQVFWETWGHLLHSVKTGENAFRASHGGQDVWEWRSAHPEENALFNKAMAENARVLADAFLDAYDFGRYGTIADIGGGNGSLLAAILKRHSGASGLLFDQPHVVETAKSVLEAARVNERCRVVAGSFFEEAPAGADAYILKSILHDWEDEDCVRILERIRLAAGAEATLLVLEFVVGPPNQDWLSKFSDLNMLVMPGGQERSEEEWRKLLASGGFELTAVVPTRRGPSVIEAKLA